MAKVITAQVLVTSSSLAVSPAVTRGRLDCSAADGGMIRFRITNGGTGPTAQAVATVLVAQKNSAMPAAAAEGTADTDWKQVYQIGGGTASSASTRGAYRFGPEVAYIEIEFTGNTGQAVTVECTGDTYAY